MNKKKIGALLITGALTLSVVGGSFAWFTSESSAINKFATPGGSSEENKDDENAGIEIWEDFDADNAANITPGGTVDKKVQFKSNVNYDQFVRVEIEPTWTELLGEEREGDLELKFTNLATDIASATDGQWVNGQDGYYYYIGRVPADAYTNQLLDTVQLTGQAGNGYKNAKLDIEIKVESVQATNNAILSVWNSANEELLSKVNNSNEVMGTVISGAEEVAGEQSKGNTGVN